MSETNQPGIQPLPLGHPVTSTNPVATPAKADAPSLDERVDQWLDKHPADKSFDEKAAPVATTTEQPQEVPSGGDAAPGTADVPPGETPPVVADPAEGGTEDAPLQAPSSVTPADQQVTQTKVEPPKPTAPEPVKFSLDAKYRFNESGPEWSGQQIVDGLRERQALLPKAQEADVYREVFEMPAAQAKELWAPNIAWMRQNPQQVQMLASIMDDPVKSAYILDCSRYWDSPEGQQLRTQQQPQQQQLQMSPEVEARFKQLEAQNKQLLDAQSARSKAQATDRITRELNVAFNRYPFLRDNPSLVQSLLARAWMLNGGDDTENSKGVLDALEEQKVLYDSQLAALNQASTIAREAGSPAAPPVVPPLMGSGGASPQASQPMRVAQPKKFGTLDDALEDWMSNPPAQFR